MSRITLTEGAGPKGLTISAIICGITLKQSNCILSGDFLLVVGLQTLDFKGPLSIGDLFLVKARVYATKDGQAGVPRAEML